jgi:hypothetical protein
MTNYNHQSSVDIGGFDSSKFRSGETPVYLSLENSFFWQISVTGFRVGMDNYFSDGSPAAYSFSTMT